MKEILFKFLKEFTRILVSSLLAAFTVVNTGCIATGDYSTSALYIAK